MVNDGETQNESVEHGRYLVDVDRVIHHWNAEAESISGYSAAEVVGHSCADDILVHVDKAGRKLCTNLCPLAASMLDGQSREAEVFLHHKQGHRVPVSVSVEVMKDESGIIVGARESFVKTVSHRAPANRHVPDAFAPLMDPLTGLPNDQYIRNEIAEELAQAKAQGYTFGLLFFNLDGMAKVNEQQGVEVGDLAICMAANTLRSILRPVDFIGRWEGDKFVCLVTGLDADNFSVMGEMLRMLIEHSFMDMGDYKTAVTASCGGATSTVDDTPESLIGRAAAYMRHAKEQGGNQVVIDPCQDEGP